VQDISKPSNFMTYSRNAEPLNRNVTFHLTDSPTCFKRNSGKHSCNC